MLSNPSDKLFLKGNNEFIEERNKAHAEYQDRHGYPPPDSQLMDLVIAPNNQDVIAPDLFSMSSADIEQYIAVISNKKIPKSLLDELYQQVGHILVVEEIKNEDYSKQYIDILKFLSKLGYQKATAILAMIIHDFQLYDQESINVVLRAFDQNKTTKPKTSAKCARYLGEVYESQYESEVKDKVILEYAITFYLHSIRLSSDQDIMSIVGCAKVYRKLGLLDKAIEYCKKATKLGPDINRYREGSEELHGLALQEAFEILKDCKHSNSRPLEYIRCYERQGCDYFEAKGIKILEDSVLYSPFTEKLIGIGDIQYNTLYATHTLSGKNWCQKDLNQSGLQEVYFTKQSMGHWVVSLLDKSGNMFIIDGNQPAIVIRDSVPDYLSLKLHLSNANSDKINKVTFIGIQIQLAVGIDSCGYIAENIITLLTKMIAGDSNWSAKILETKYLEDLTKEVIATIIGDVSIQYESIARAPANPVTSEDPELAVTALSCSKTQEDLDLEEAIKMSMVGGFASELPQDELDRENNGIDFSHTNLQPDDDAEEAMRPLKEQDGSREEILLTREQQTHVAEQDVLIMGEGSSTDVGFVA